MESSMEHESEMCEREDSGRGNQLPVTEQGLFISLQLSRNPLFLPQYEGGREGRFIGGLPGDSCIARKPFPSPSIVLREGEGTEGSG